MNTKHFLHSLILIALLLGLFASASPALAASCGTSVTVVSGDTLRKIADRCVTTVSALRRANPEIGSGDLIYPGQVLLLPGAIINGNNGYNTYIVMRGDTLRLLANRFGTSIDTLVSLNGSIVNVNLIYEGQRLVVPSGQGVPVPPPPTGGQVYYVQRGDTLRKIAAKFSVTLEALIRANPQISNPNVIYVGQAITIPGQQASTHIVQRGDTLRIIAAKYGTTVDALLALNPNIKNANLIYVGQVIRVS